MVATEAPPPGAGGVARTSAPLVQEEARQRELEVMKRRATGLLVAVTGVFVVVTVLDDGGARMGYLRAAAEAAMVGGLADWFAVTAIFRHPLGVPVPHTNVIAERKEQFGRTLGDFVQKNFLNADTVTDHVRASGLVRKTAEWLAEPANAEKLAAHLAGVTVGLADVIREEDVHRLVEREVRRAVEAVPLAPLAGRVLRVAVSEGRDQDLLDAALPALEAVLRDNRLSLHTRFAEGSPWWLPERVEAHIFDRLFDGVLDLLEDVRDEPNHELRLQFSQWMSTLVKRLETSPELRDRGEDLKQRLLAHPELRRWSRSLWADVKTTLRAQAADPGSDLRGALCRGVVAAGRRVLDDPALLAKAEGLAEGGVRRMVEQFHDDIAALVATTIDRWDGAETSRKLELLLGRDLQFIRINGTVVGGVAGVAIHAVADVLG